jgi:hypothetical protein
MDCFVMIILERKSIMFKSYLKSLLVLGLLSTASLKPARIKESNFFAPSKLGKIKVYHDEDGFSVKKDGQTHRVQNCFVDKEIRNLKTDQLDYFFGNKRKVEINGQEVEFVRISQEQFEKFNRISGAETIELDEAEQQDLLKALNPSTGYLVINQMSDGEYSIKAQSRLLGGGGIGALVGYWGTKAVGYGGIMLINIVTTGPVGIAIGIQECIAAAPTIETVAVAAEMVGLLSNPF